MEAVHVPVLVKEAAGLLAPIAGGVYVDATVGLGGHAGEILKMIGEEGRVIGIDRDEKALELTRERIPDTRLILQKASFSDIGPVLDTLGISGADGILFDLGVSMMQLKDMGRGFSFYSEERLDMRMNREDIFSAWDVINGYSEADLVRILKEYGEEYRAQRIVRAIVSSRSKKTIDTCAELAGIIARAVGRQGRLHPATKTFQALRIEVNRELDELSAALNVSLDVLKRGGRLAVISYHSLEDRIVKNFIRENAKSNRLVPLIKKPVIPSVHEMRENPASRSAKLRGAEKI